MNKSRDLLFKQEERRGKERREGGREERREGTRTCQTSTCPFSISFPWPDGIVVGRDLVFVFSWLQAALIFFVFFQCKSISYNGSAEWNITWVHRWDILGVYALYYICFNLISLLVEGQVSNWLMVPMISEWISSKLIVVPKKKSGCIASSWFEISNTFWHFDII